MPTGPVPMTKKQAVTIALVKAVKDGDCLLRTTKATFGIGYKIICANGRQFYAHRLVYEICKGPILTGVIRHTCDRPNCINPDHLIDGTHKDNVKDKVQKLRHGFGKTHYAAKLTEEIVRDMRLVKPPKFKEWSVKYGITTGALKSAYYNHTWKHVK